MPNLSARYIILYTVIVFFILFLFSNSFTCISCIKNINPGELLKSKSSGSYVRRMIINSSVENQYYIFPDESPLVRLYLDVVRDTICGLTLRTQERSVAPGTGVNIRPLNINQRIVGEDWPLIGISMIGQKRLMNIEWALRLIIGNGISGDFIECGVWRGGGSIFARAVFKALNMNDRHVWLADSFQGLPKARTSNDDDQWEKQEYLKVLI
jgi:hypothetical protein